MSDKTRKRVKRAEKVKTEETVDPKDLQIRGLERQLSQVRETMLKLTREKKYSLAAENVRQALKDVVRSGCTPLEPFKAKEPRVPTKTQVTEHCVMHVSDEHADEVIHPHRVNDLEAYNLNVALRRAENYVDGMLKFTQTTLAGYHFPVLWVLFNGDHVNGEIHGSNDHSHLRNKFANAIAVGQMHALMLRDLAPYFDRINCVCMCGNHGRQSVKKDYERALNNLDYLVHETTVMQCSNLRNVEFLVPDSHSVNVAINGFNFNIAHGDDIRGWNGIPWYGIQRRNSRLQAIHAVQDLPIHYKVLGHFHQASSAADGLGETIINGSWKATDPYIYNSHSGYNRPCQWIHGVHETNGVTWRLPVYLASEDDIEGPKRYKVSLGNEFLQSQLEG